MTDSSESEKLTAASTFHVSGCAQGTYTLSDFLPRLEAFHHRISISTQTGRCLNNSVLPSSLEGSKDGECCKNTIWGLPLLRHCPRRGRYGWSWYIRDGEEGMAGHIRQNGLRKTGPSSLPGPSLATCSVPFVENRHFCLSGL